MQSDQSSRAYLQALVVYQEHIATCELYAQSLPCQYCRGFNVMAVTSRPPTPTEGICHKCGAVAKLVDLGPNPLRPLQRQLVCEACAQ